MKCITDT